MSIIISEYFKNMTFPHQLPKSNLEKFAKEKRLNSLQNFSNPRRSVCQMIRDINVRTTCKYQNTLLPILYYIHLSVLKLGKYKQKWIEYLKNDQVNSIYKGRSTFSESKKKLAIDIYIHIKHPIFEEFKEFYKDINDKNIKNLLLECIYYIYQINKRLALYENNNINL